MSSRNTIQDELRGLNSELSPDFHGTPYAVPSGYFESLAEAVLAKIKRQNLSPVSEIAELSPLLAGLSKKMPFSIPDDYFQTSIENLPLAAFENEESAMLSFIGKEMPYDVPAGYFENLPVQLLSKVAGTNAKVVPFRRKVVRLMAAAVVIGVMAVAGIFYFTKGGTDTNNNTTPTDVAVELKKVSTEELDEFIKSADINLTDETTQVTAKNTMKPKEAKIFRDVTDEELKAFLEQLPVEEEVFMD